MLEDHFAPGIDDEAHVEEAVLQIRMPRLGLGHDERVVLTRHLAQVIGFVAGDVDRAFAREFHMIQIQDFIVESLQRAFRDGDQAHRKAEARQPRRRLDEVRQVLQVDLDVLALADAAHGGDEANGRVWLDHNQVLR